MPELKHNFTAGKMNKDVDERLVPNGEYRDAMNIQIRTTSGGDAFSSESSDGVGNAGTVQNIQGNVAVGEPYTVPNSSGETSSIVGSISDEKNDVGYFFVSSPTFSQSEVYDADNIDTTTIWADSIVEQHADGTMTYVLVDRFCVAGTFSDIAVDTYMNVSIAGVGWSGLNVQDAGMFRVGMELSAISSGNLNLLQNIEGTLGRVRIIDIDYEDNILILENPQPDGNLFDCAALIAEMPVEERLLNFDPNRLITGVNIIDNLLFWTDNFDEPKKINIDRCKVGTNLVDPNNPNITIPNSGNSHTVLFVEDPSSGDLVPINEVEPTVDTTDLKKEHITVIRKAPTTAPVISMRNTERTGVVNFSLSSADDAGNIFTQDGIPVSGGGSTYTLNIPQLDPPIELRVNDTISLTSNANPQVPVVLIARVVTVFASGSSITIELIQVDENLGELNILWEVELLQGKPLFELKIGRFGYRYKYEDGEVSTFSPWSELAFLPGSFRYTPYKGFNNGMINNVRRITISNFIPIDSRRPNDVKSVEILYKTTDDQNVYVIKTITREVDSEWELFSTVQGSNTGALVLTSEMIHRTLESNQLIRSWDNVPRYAKSQEITGSRLLYGNYTQGYFLREQVGLTQYIRSITVPSLQATKSVKSLREYKWGMVFGDKFGRETPVIARGDVSGVAGNTSVTMGDVMIDKSLCATSNHFVLAQNWEQNPPSWIKYVKYYVKETSSEYYNLVMDRWYDAEDGNIWISFPSADRNKVDEDTYLILKNQHGTQTPVLTDARYKILAIENEAPDYIRRHGFDFEKVRIPNSIVYGFGPTPEDEDGNNIVDWQVWQSQANVTGVPTGLINDRKIIISSGQFNDLGLNKDYFKGQVRVRVVAYYVPSNSGTDADLVVADSILNDASVYKTSWKKVARVIDFGESRGVMMDETFGSETNAYFYFINTLNVSIDLNANPLSIVYYLEFQDDRVINKPEFDGRFFCKIEKDFALSSNVLNEDGIANYSILEEYSLTFIDNASSNPANNNSLEYPSTSYAQSLWNDNGANLDPVFQTGGPSDDATVSGFWNAWSNHPNRKCNLFIDGVNTNNFYDALGYIYDSIDGIAFSVEGAGNFIDDDYDGYFGAWGSNSNLLSNDGNMGEYLNGNFSIEPSIYSNFPENNTGLSIGTTTNAPRALRTGENTDGTMCEMTISALGQNWPGGKDLELRSLLMTPGEYFKFRDDPNDEIYVVVDTGVFKVFDDTVSLYPVTDVNLPTFTVPEIHVLPLPYFVTGIKNVSSPLSSTDFRQSFITRFRKVDKTTGQPLDEYTGIDTDVWDPRSLVYHNGVADADGNGGEMIIQRVAYGVNLDNLQEEQLTTNSACWETEPKKSADLDLYYEASSGIPLILDEQSIIPFTSPATRSSVPATVSIDNTNQLTIPYGSFVNDIAGGNSVQIYGPSGIPITSGISIGDTLRFKHHDGTVTKSRVQEFVTINQFGTVVPNVPDQVSFPNALAINSSFTTSSAVQFGFIPEGATQYEGDLDIILLPAAGPQGNGTQDIVVGSSISYSVPDTQFQNIVLDGSVVYVTPPSSGQVLVFVTGNTIPQEGIGTGADGGFNFFISAEITFTSPGASGWYRIDQNVYNYEVELNWFNCYAFGNGVESDRIRDDFNAPTIDNGFKVSTTFSEYGEEKRSSSMIYSGLYNSTSGINELNQFNMGEKITKDLNPVYGSIQAMKTRDTDVIVFTEDKVFKVLSNKDAVFNADGSSGLTATQKVLGTAIPFVGDYGISKNPESLAWDQFRMYFTDKQRGAVLRLSRDGLTPISSVGMKSWFRDHLPISKNLVGSYDVVNGEYNLTLYYNEQDTITIDDNGNWFSGVQQETITFNEASKGWVSFKSFIVKSGISVSGKYLTAFNNIIYEHNRDDVNRNTFANEFTESTITVLFNDNPGSIKSFNTIGYEGSQSRVVQYAGSTEVDVNGNTVVTPGFTTTNDGEYYNLNSKQGWYIEPESVFLTEIGSISTDSGFINGLSLDEVDVPIEISGGINTDMNQFGSVPEFIEKENKWFNKITGRTMDTTSLNLLDSSAFTIQGIGTALSAWNQSNMVITDGGITIDDIDTTNWGDDNESTDIIVGEDDTEPNTTVNDVNTDLDVTGPWAEFTYMSSNQNNSGIKLKDIFEDEFIKESGDTITVSYNITLVDTFPNQDVFNPDDSSSDTLPVIPITTEIGGIVQPIFVGTNVYLDGDGLLVNTSGTLNAEVNRTYAKEVVCTMMNSNYGNHIKIERPAGTGAEFTLSLSSGGIYEIVEGAKIVISNFSIRVISPIGTLKFSKSLDLTNIVDGNGDAITDFTSYTNLGALDGSSGATGTVQITGTNAQPNIDGLRESSVEGDMGYRVFTTAPYGIPLIP